ncbi:plasmid replication protein RepC [Celeribacter neptunius]|uniref:Replication initiation protein RepC n=1 Tax=Celeribacter neptunius TaxID=588602 RepID=A0A1I3Y0E9_9RHOB|nr:plasmid replication protein RepC [Celeribacter neptunius]SFK25233.1 replication initiation protein RepC [Celeribacter neptunius]
MTYTPVSPFRRTIDAVILKHQARSNTELPPSGVNKWEALRELSAAREAFGLTDRDMTVLQALVSFHQATILGGNDSNLVVHPSNKSICERLNGMPASTMRRHLGRLVHAGVVIRRDSPNGKRYARRFGEEKIVYGFDLTPLAQRFEEFCSAAEQVRAEQEAFRRLREAVSLMRRDLASLSVYGEEMRPDLSIWPQFSDLAALTARTLRRKLDMADLERIEADLSAALVRARNILEPSGSENMSTNESQNEQHYQNSNKDSYDSELHQELVKGAGVDSPALPDQLADTEERAISETGVELDPPEPDIPMPNLPLGLVLRGCREILTYADGSVRHWHEFVRTAEIVRPMMGISPSAWDEAKRHMGPVEASVVLAAMLERIAEIRSPGGYLRSLSAKAASGEFSSGPMVMALMRKEAA